MGKKVKKLVSKTTNVATLGLVGKGPIPNVLGGAFGGSAPSGMSSSGSDYYNLANQQAALGRENDIWRLQNSGQSDFYGKSEWVKDPVTGQLSQKNTMSDALQNQHKNASDQFNKYQGQIANQGEFKGPNQVADYTNQAGKIADYQNKAGALNDITNQGGSIADYVNKAGPVAQYDPNSGKAAGEAMYNSYMSRASGDQAEAVRSAGVKLRQQGLQAGTAAYDRAMKNLLTAHGDANAKAQFDSQIFGGNESRSNYGSILAGQNQSWTQGIGDQDAMLRTQGQRFQQGFDIDGANASRQNQRWNQGVGDYQTMLSGQGQRFQQGISDYETKMQGQNQNFNQDLQKYQMPWMQAQDSLSMWNSLNRGPQGYAPSWSGQAADLMGAKQAGDAASQAKDSSKNAKKGNTLSSAATVGAAYF